MYISIIQLSFRFYDVVFEHYNASEIKNLTCGRVMLQKRSNLMWWSKKENHWKKDPDCVMEWHPDGITCNCKHVGTYALLRTTTYYKVSNIFFYILNDLYAIKKKSSTRKICISPGMGSLWLYILPCKLLWSIHKVIQDWQGLFLERCRYLVII